MPPALAAVGAVVGAISGAVAAVAGVVSSLGIIGSLALTAGLSMASKALHGSTDPPPARGSVTQIVIDPNAAQPYVMGEGLAGGALIHDVAFGPTLNDVPNPYRFMAIVYSGGGPVFSVTPYVDQAPIDTGYYGGFLAAYEHLGACPQTVAMAPAFYSPAPGWGANSKTSGEALIGWNFKFDRDGKVFAGGLPQLGAYGKWVWAYDPRLDSTFPGGSGSHRIANELSWAWTENPALHAGTYAYGRYQNGKRTIGCGLPYDAIDWSAISAWANVCDANGWKMFGIVYEPGDRWQNIKDIAAAGGGMPLITGGVLSFHYQAPRLSIETIVEADLYEDDMSVTAMRSYRDRINAISPKYRDPNSNWEMVNAELVSVASHIAEDGEVKQVEWPFNFVKDVNQAAQLARYLIEDSREFQPIEITCQPTMRGLRAGDCVELDLPSLGLITPAVITQREVDPATLKVKLTLMGETPGKHAFALGQTGTPPPTPMLAMTGQQRDTISWGAARVPADSGATQNADGANMLGDPITLSNSTFSGGALLDLPAGPWGRLADRYRIKLPRSVGAFATGIFDEPVSCTPNETLYVRYVATITGTAGTETFYCAGITYDADMNVVGNTGPLPGTTVAGTDVPVWTVLNSSVVVPTGVAFIRFYVTRPTSAQAFDFYAAEPYVNRAQAGSTVGAPTGTFVGGRAAIDVANTISSGGGVAVNQVITSSITNASVNAVSNAYSSGAASFPATTYTTIQSVSLTTSGGAGAVVALKAALNLSINDQAFLAVSLRITRDGTAIYDAAVPQTYTDVPAIPARVFFCSYLGTVSFSDTPGAGAHTYALQIYSSVATGSPTNPQVTNRYLEAIEIKK